MFYKGHVPRWPTKSKMCFSHSTLYHQISSSHGPSDPAEAHGLGSVSPPETRCQSTHWSMQTESGILVAHILSPPIGRRSEHGCASRDDVTFYPDYKVPPGVTCTKRCMKVLAPAYSTFCTGNNTRTYFFLIFRSFQEARTTFSCYTTLKTAVHWYKTNWLHI